MISGRVLITGGTGSLGRAILRRAELDGWDAALTVFSRDEAKQAAIRERHPGTRCVLGDVRDGPALEAAMRGIDVVIHAAAYKRVPEAERQPITCAEANVIGSANVVNAARRIGTPRVVAISTDKACGPINAYGATKLLMERMFAAEALERPDGPAFTIARYGNVIASNGSVVPAFRAQAAAGGPLRLTDPDSTRFWLTLDDAVDLVMAALGLPSGSVLVPRCRASSMLVMAEAVAPEVGWVAIANRGGEKRHEVLLSAHESPYAAISPLGFVLGPMVGQPLGLLADQYQYSSDVAPQYSVTELRAVLADLDGLRPMRTIIGE
jgi:UDP-N-acetylglucosamine 4,6-dehydratase